MHCSHLSRQEGIRNGFRVERRPTGSWEKEEASTWSCWTSWVLAKQLETTRELKLVGSSDFDSQKAPYVKDADGSVVFTHKAAMVNHSLLARDPLNPKFQAVHIGDVAFMTPLDTNEQVEDSTTYAEPAGTDALAQQYAHVSQLPTLKAQDKCGAVAQGDSQLGGLKQLCADGHAQCVLHAGPSVYGYLGTTTGACEMVPGQRAHKFGLKLVQMPPPSEPAPSPSPPAVAVPAPPSAVSPLVSSPQPPAPSPPTPAVTSSTQPSPAANFVAIGPSPPKLKGRHAQPTPAVQTTTSLDNCLRRLSNFPEIAVESSPLWGLTSKAKTDQQLRLGELMPRLSNEFKADTSGQAQGGEG